MTQRITYAILFLSVCISCRPRQNAPLVFHDQLPASFNWELAATDDTMRLKLTDETFDASSWNWREVNGQAILVFFDRFSLILSEYQYPSLELTRQIDLSSFFKPGSVNSAYLKDYQHIFLTTDDKLLVVDTSGKIHRTFFFGDNDQRQRAVISAGNPLTFMGDNIYISLNPGMDRTSKSAMRKWEIMWSANLKNNTTDKQYHMPEMYWKNLYQSKFTRYSYCVNDSGRFVISFSADTLLYETDLKDYNHAWIAKTLLQSKPVAAIPKGKTLSISEERLIYLRNTHYPAIFYDKARQRYLRLTKPAFSEEEIKNSDFKHGNRVVILDKNFHIIGESDLPLKIHLQKTIFTPDGKIYSQISSGQEDILALVRLEYRESKLTTK